MSAPSPVMQATDDLDTYFYVHTLAVGADGKLRLLKPDRIDLPGQQIADLKFYRRLKPIANSCETIRCQSASVPMMSRGANFAILVRVRRAAN